MISIGRGLAAWLAVLLLVAPGAAQQQTDLRVGQWVRVKGAFESDSPSALFRAAEIELMAPDDDQTLTGTVEAMKGPARLVLLGQEVHLSAKTEYSGVQPGDLRGKRIKVEGDYRGPRKFSAGSIRARGPGRDAIEGRIDWLDRTERGTRLRITRYDILLLPDAIIELDGVSLETLELAPEVKFVTTDNLRTRDDDDEINRSVQLTDTISIGGQLEFVSDVEDNFDLNDIRRADRSTNDASVRLEAVYEPDGKKYFLAGLRTRYRWRKDQDDPDISAETTTVSEAFGYFRDLGGTGWDLQVGRQDFDERREWLYDENLDAVRAIRSTPDWRLELSLSTTLADGSQRNEDSTNAIAYLSNNDLRKHLAAYILYRTEGSDRFATHLGARALGSWFESQDVWAEVAVMRGEDGVDLEGYGFDLGSTWAPDAGRFEGLSLTAGYALGSGDDGSGGGTNGTFRQSGLQDNNDTFDGVTSFRYYGELFDPELANLGILTLGVGFRLGPKTSVDLVLHKYDQVEAFDQLINSSLRRRPSGTDRDLGWEADLIFGNRTFTNLSIEIIGAYFEPGDAFPDADSAWLTKFQLRYRF